PGHSGEGIAAINVLADQALAAVGNPTDVFLSCIIAITMSAAVIFAIDYRLGLAALAIGGIAAFAQSRFAGPLGRISKERLDSWSEAVKEVSNTLSGATTIRAFGIQEKARGRFDGPNTALKALSFKEAAISMWRDLFTSLQGWLTLVMVFALGGWLVAAGRLEFPVLMMAPGMCVALSNGMSGIGAAIAGMQAPAAAAERAFGILDSYNEPGTRNPEKDTEDNGYRLQIKNLNFRYTGAESDTLQNVNLTVEENETVVFIGASGSGKSTLLKAVIGLYEREGLDIQLGGRSITETDPRAWRRRFAYVDQSCKLFDMTVAENIALGSIGAGTPGREEIEEAAKRAAAHEFICALPQGYDTPVGEKGSALSGGQKQRIAIARALCRKAPVLVFDEAASALDAETERAIMETVTELGRDHTVLIITHNPENVPGAAQLERQIITGNVEKGIEIVRLSNKESICH
ncbi:MAG: ABC transporter ATP-binding protein/permease, partial [Clostridiales bacterium]|nr:ABC transporter ATP-binding protein/permease [Clostridiales bacterium]